MYKQGDIVLVKFPFTDGTDFKKRPALIISNDTVNNSGDLILIQITSKNNISGLAIPIEDIETVHKLPIKSYVLKHKIFTINRMLVLSKITEMKSFYFNNLLKIIIQNFT